MNVADPEQAWAVVGDDLFWDLVEITDDPNRLDQPGDWIVCHTFEGDLTAARFRCKTKKKDWYGSATAWSGLGDVVWQSSMERSAYLNAVAVIRDAIEAGDVYQVNLCRTLSTPWPFGEVSGDNLRGFAAAVAARNPAPHASAIHLPDVALHVVSASPESFLRRDGDRIESSPIKGTGREPDDLQDKDRAENVMIVDLVRNDLSRICVAGSVEVPSLLRVEAHPGLVHLVSTVSGRLRSGLGWSEILAATTPAGSVSGTPKHAALDLIKELESGPRGLYCGAIGRISDVTSADLAVGIRTFVVEDGMLKLGTGAGITWGSDPTREWKETELKTARLMAIARGTAQ